MKYIATLIAFFLLSTLAFAGTFAAPEEKVEAAVYLWHLINECRAHPMDTIRSLGIDENAAREALGPDSWILDEGLPPLAWNDLLAQSASDHNRDMIDNVYYSSLGLDGSSVSDRISRVGYNAVMSDEILGVVAFSGFMDPLEAAKIIFENWVGDELDPGHVGPRKLFNEGCTEVGIAIIGAVLDLGSDVPSNLYLAVADLARPVEQRVYVLGSVYNDINGDRIMQPEEAAIGQRLVLTEFLSNRTIDILSGILGGYQVLLPQGFFTIDVMDTSGNILVTYAGFGGGENYLVDLRVGR